MVSNERGVSRAAEMDKFRHVIEAGIRHQTPSSVLSLFINLTLHAVSRDDIFVSPTLIEKWMDIIGNENKAKQEEKLKGLQCICMDGKSINAALGHHQTKREHELIFVKEPPPVEYIEHLPCGETGVAMARAATKIIMDTESWSSLVVIGVGESNVYTVKLGNKELFGCPKIVP